MSMYLAVDWSQSQITNWLMIVYHINIINATVCVFVISLQSNNGADFGRI